MLYIIKNVDCRNKAHVVVNLTDISYKVLSVCLVSITAIKEKMTVTEQEKEYNT